MKKRLFSVLLSIACMVTALPVSASAAAINQNQSSGPVLSGSVSVSVVDRAYDYVLFDESNSSKYLNEAYFWTSNVLLTANNGSVYNLSQTSLLHDSDSFTSKLSVTVNPMRADSLTIVRDSHARPGYACYKVHMGNSAVLDQQTYGFDSVYTARKDLSLPVVGTGANAGKTFTMTVKQGAKITLTHKLHVNYERLLDLHYTAKYDAVLDKSLVNDHNMGADGVVITPRSDYDEGKNVVWKELNRIEAEVDFNGASAKSFWKMSTRWDDPKVLKMFAEGVAFIRSFWSNSFTGEVGLYLTNPYLTIDGDETIPHEDVVIYELLDNRLYDVTSQFSYTLNSDDAGAFYTDADHVGTYIFYDRTVS